MREGIEGTRVVLGIEGSRKPYYSCPDIAKAMWKDALIHKDNQDIIYWVKLEIATHQQSKTIGNLLDLPDASNSAVVSLVQLLAPDLSRCRILLDYLAGIYVADTLVRAQPGLLQEVVPV